MFHIKYLGHCKDSVDLTIIFCGPLKLYLFLKMRKLRSKEVKYFA